MKVVSMRSRYYPTRPLGCIVDAKVIGEADLCLGRSGAFMRLHFNRIQCFTCVIVQNVRSRWVGRPPAGTFRAEKLKQSSHVMEGP